jgi:hypothetical protein
MNVMITEIPTRNVSALFVLWREVCFQFEETATLLRHLLQHSGALMYKIKLYFRYTNQQMYSVIKY